VSVTLETFSARFPEFDAAPANLVEACIAEAAVQIDATVYGTKYDAAVQNLAAHLIATNPLGEMARLQAKDGSTVYQKHYEKLKRMVASGFRVA
jgi:hypothetical protein